jgi:hypothetical protein
LRNAITEVAASPEAAASTVGDIEAWSASLQVAGFRRR